VGRTPAAALMARAPLEGCSPWDTPQFTYPRTSPHGCGRDAAAAEQQEAAFTQGDCLPLPC
jgi:hypothetical protein